MNLKFSLNNHYGNTKKRGSDINDVYFLHFTKSGVITLQTKKKEKTFLSE